MRVAYARFLRLSRLNFGHLITSAVTSRMVPTGFRTAAAGDEDGDALAMATWRRSHLDIVSRDLFDDVATYGAGYTLNDAAGQILKLSPWSTLTEASPLTPWSPDAGINVGHNPAEGFDVITLFRPATDGRPAYSRRAAKESKLSTIPTDGRLWMPGRGWDWIEDPQPIRWISDIPIVDYRAPKGFGQFEPHLDTLDRINHTILQRLTITAMQAFRQRAFKGNIPTTYPDDHPLAGQPVDLDSIFSAGPAALWILPEGADVWESQTTDITPILAGVDKDLKYLAAVSSTPLYILSPDAASGSAAGASLARETLVFKVEDLDARMGDGLARAMGNSFAAQGDNERADVAQIETIWQPADRSSIIERAAAAASAATTLSRRSIGEKIYQLTPAELAREEQNWSDQAFTAVPVAPAAPPVAVNG